MVHCCWFHCDQIDKYIDGQGWFGLTWNQADGTAWLYDDVINSGLADHHLQLERDGDLFRIFINGQYLGGYVDDQPLAAGYYGLINWASQFEQALADFDDYKVVAWDASGQQVTAQSVAQPAVPQRAGAVDRISMQRLEGVKKVE